MLQDFITHAYVGKRNVVRDLLTGVEYPYSTGADPTTASEAQLTTITTRAEAEAAAVTAQRTLVAAMRASGDLAPNVVTLEDLKTAYAAYQA